MKTILVDAVQCFVIEKEGKYGIFKVMYHLLETYPNLKIILTGANDEQAKAFGLNNMPYPIFSLKHDPEKTNPKYFEMMLHHFKLKAKEVIYFEHSKEAVKSAQSVGISTYFYDNDKKDLISLKRFIDQHL